MLILQGVPQLGGGVGKRVIF